MVNVTGVRVRPAQLAGENRIDALKDEPDKFTEADKFHEV